MVKIYIVRHGHSIGNEQNIVTGHYDCDLSETGKKQAVLVSEYIVKNIKVDKFYSSDLIRAINTIMPAADNLNLSIEKEICFRERSAGIWEGISFKEYEAWVNNEMNSCAAGEETWERVYQRSTQRLNEIVATNENKNIVISTHCGVIKTLLSYFLGNNLSCMNDLEWVSNASITEVWYSERKYEIKKMGFDDYLGGLTTQLPKTI